MKAKDGFLTVEQAADVLKVHRNTIRNYIKRGDLPAYKQAGTRAFFVERDAVEALRQPRPIAR